MGFFSCCNKLWLVLTVISVSYFAFLSFPSISTAPVSKALGYFGAELSVIPQDERGFLWTVGYKALILLGNLPYFLFNCKGDRLTMFKQQAEHVGDIFPFNEGIAFADYETVASVLADKNQPRGRYLGAQIVPDACMGADTLIFLSTGEQHTKARDFLLKSVHTFSVNPSKTPELVIRGAVPLDANMTVVKRVLVTNIYTRMFGDEPSEALVDELMKYYTYGAACVLGELVHKVTFGVILKQVRQIRTAATAAIRETPIGKNIIKLAERDGMSKEETGAFLVQVADGFMFAGMLGTTHLTTKTLNILRKNPEKWIPIYRDDPKSFLLESARIDPPVTSVTALLAEDKTLTVAHKTHTFKAGTTTQLAIATAHRDPKLFSSPEVFDPSRANLDKILSWNGLESAVAVGAAPRGCPGHDLSLSIAIDVINYFTDTQSSPAASPQQSKPTPVSSSSAPTGASTLAPPSPTSASSPSKSASKANEQRQDTGVAKTSTKTSTKRSIKTPPKTNAPSSSSSASKKSSASAASHDEL